MGRARAHDFWIQPADDRPAADVDTVVVLRVGHAGAPQRSNLPRRRITRFVATDAKGRTIDLLPRLEPGGRHDDGRFRLPEGRHQLVLESDAGALSHLPAGRFNAHLEAEGLEPALAHRRQTGRTGTDGSERYGRVAKALVQVGSPALGGTQAAGWPVQPAGLPLEIVLEQEPDAASERTHATLRVYERDVPLPGALLKLGRLDGTPGPVGAWRTGHDGRVRVPMPEAGQWLATVAWTRVLPAGSESDYETWFSSLAFRTEEGTPPRRSAIPGT